MGDPAVSRAPRVTGRHLVPCVAVLLASLWCGGCAAGHGTEHAAEPAAAAAPAPGTTLAEIAAALGCTAEITVDAEELKEGACGAGQEAYRMATFTAGQGQQAWLAESRMYGGTYLVGDRWVVTAASAEALTPLRERLGGTIETGASHGSEHSSEHSPEHSSEHSSEQGSEHGAEHGSEHGPEHGPAPGTEPGPGPS
ncbi:hypothetical protein ACFWBF_01455 [Streptomyces sp. NPDC060028]|uniref:hypothetical protein n=1 Tax=Streptomyces sp. NPDC060028 TaxID=3347041 RepID=UPI0036B1864E